MRAVFFSLVFFIFPTCICRFLCLLFGGKNYSVGKNCHIGFSLIKAGKVILADNTNIGHFNVIKTNEIYIDGKIKHLNIISGRFVFKMENRAWMLNQNKITGSNIDGKVINSFVMRRESSIIVHHIFDVTDNITIGEKTCVAGYGSQIWTHSFIFGKQNKAAQVSKSVEIGKNCYIGSSCVICPGVSIADNTVIGSHTTVSKSLKVSGLYVGQGIRYIPYDPDVAIRTIEENGSGYIFNR